MKCGYGNDYSAMKPAKCKCGFSLGPGSLAAKIPMLEAQVKRKPVIIIEDEDYSFEEPEPILPPLDIEPISDEELGAFFSSMGKANGIKLTDAAPKLKGSQEPEKPVKKRGRPKKK